MQSILRASSLGSIRQRPPGREMLEGPKSVRSKMTTLLSCISCMCIADMPTFACKRRHFPWLSSDEGMVWDTTEGKKIKNVGASKRNLTMLTDIELGVAPVDITVRARQVARCNELDKTNLNYMPVDFVLRT